MELKVFVNELKCYLRGSGEVTQPLNEGSVVCARHRRRQHTHSLSPVASKLTFLHHLFITTTQEANNDNDSCHNVDLSELHTNCIFIFAGRELCCYVLLLNPPGSRCAAGGCAGKAMRAPSAHPRDDWRYKYFTVTSDKTLLLHKSPQHTNSALHTADRKSVV